MSVLGFFGLVIGLSCAFGFFGFLIWGTVGTLCLVLLIWVLACIYHGVYLYRLNDWLKTQDVNALPTHAGVWQGAFDELLAQTKSQKKRELALNQSLERYHRIIGAIPSGVLLLNDEGRIEWKNALADDYLGLSLTQDTQGILKNLVRLPEFHQFLDKANSERQKATIAKIVIDYTIPVRTLWLTCVPFEKTANILIAHDISASEQLNITRSAFIANVSHELRTPLTVVSGFLETLEDIPDIDHNTRLEFIHLMQKESGRMLTLIEDLLTLSRLESQSVQEITFEPVSLSQMIASIVADVCTRETSHKLITHIEDNIWMDGLAKDLYSAFSNLIFNAIRHTPFGTTVTIELSRHPDGIYFVVRDTGDGIAPEHLNHLTERFYRVDKGRSRKTGGSGLGLAIVKHALAIHGASLSIDSQLGVGSEFKVVFLLGK